ncbi:RluA family pseudouridine synthase, partial [Candidatus Parcubacteria bacterium]
KVKIHTGRTHQIRVHMLALGVPVVGDPLYKNKKLVKKGDMELDRLFLCARELCFDDLLSKRKCFNVDLPQKLQDYLKRVI